MTVPAWQNTPPGAVEPAWYVVWVQAPDHVKPMPGVSYDDVHTTRLPPPATEQQILGERRPSGWVLQKLDGGCGPGRAVIHAIDGPASPRSLLRSIRKTGAPRSTSVSGRHPRR
ncbi:hypothetical protein ABZ517_23280 [Streptomyces scabiei]|uniref:hypothetical protein n=1 Tax=Streptomyces scabiei TaxID=1930 RepID=UPI0033D3D4FE